MKRRKWNLFFIVAIPLVCSCGTKQQQDTAQCILEEGVRKTMRYLVPDDYMADPAVHVFNDRFIFILLMIGKVGLLRMITVTISI